MKRSAPRRPNAARNIFGKSIVTSDGPFIPTFLRYLGFSYSSETDTTDTSDSHQFSYILDDRRDVIAYLLDINGLCDKAMQIMNLAREASFWSIADRITQEFLETGDKGQLLRLTSTLEQLMEYADIDETEKSCYIINYDLARLYSALNDEERARTKLAEAYKENHDVIAKRIKFVPELDRLGVMEEK